MADNVTITKNANSTPPDGTIIATDEVSGVQYQIMKLATGGDGVATLVSSDNMIPVATAQDAPLDRWEIQQQILLNTIIEQLLVMNMHLSAISSEEYSVDDIEEIIT